MRLIGVTGLDAELVIVCQLALISLSMLSTAHMISQHMLDKTALYAQVTPTLITEEARVFTPKVLTAGRRETCAIGGTC